MITCIIKIEDYNFYKNYFASIDKFCSISINNFVEKHIAINKYCYLGGKMWDESDINLTEVILRIMSNK